MDWRKAIEKSERNQAVRVDENEFKTYTTIKEFDGTGVFIFGKKMMNDFSNVRKANSIELNGYYDWKPR